jgi:hypothetical protein
MAGNDEDEEKRYRELRVVSWKKTRIERRRGLREDGDSEKTGISEETETPEETGV